MTLPKLQIPPIRTQLNDPTLPPGQTACEWYFYWNNVGSQVNAIADQLEQIQAGGDGGGGGDAQGHAGSNAPAVTDFVKPSSAKLLIGDGANHPLSEFYGTLDDAKVNYPFAQSLTDTLAWCAIQSAIYHSAYVFLPLGSYVVNRPIDCTNRLSGGLHFYGAGQQSQRPVVYTDLVVNAGDPTKITSAANPFKQWNQWMVLQITGGTGFTPQQVMITSVSSAGVATCAKSAGIPGSSGGQAKTISGVGSRIIANTGGVVFDCSGSGMLTFEDFFIDGATGTSTIGFLFGRTYDTQRAESALMNLTRVLVVLRGFVHDGINVNQCLNGGQYLGSIGVVNWASENFTILHCYFEADRAYIGQNILPMSITDDYPVTVDSDSVSHGQPLRFFLPESPYANLYGGDTAVPVHITNVTVSGGIATFTTSEDLHDPALFIDRGGGAIGWYAGGVVTVRGVTGFTNASTVGGPSSSYPVNFTTRVYTLTDSHSFTVAFTSNESVAGSYAGGGTAFLTAYFSEGMVATLNSSFIGKGGPCVTLGGVDSFQGYNIYTLSYHPSFNPNIYAAYQITGQCYGVHLTGASELVSRILYSRYVVYNLRIDIDNPQDPDPGISRVWLDGQFPDPEGAILVPGITAGYVRVNPLLGQPAHQIIEANVATGNIACKAVLAPNQNLALANGLVNVQVENSENADPGLPSTGIYDLATQWGRRQIGGPLTVSSPIYSTGSAIRINAPYVGADTDVQISLVEATSPIIIHTFTDHGLVEGQRVSMYDAVGIVPSVPIVNLPCHVLTSNSITIPGVSGSGTYFAGGFLRAFGKPAILGLFDGGTLIWALTKAAPGNFALYDARLNRTALSFDRDLAVIGAAGITYTDLVIGTDNTTCTSAGKPFFDPISVGQTLNITGGTGFTVQTVTITSVAGNVAHCSAALGTAGSTGGTAFNQFVIQLVGDYIQMPKQAAAPSTLDYLSIDSAGTLIPRTKAQSQTDLGIASGTPPSIYVNGVLSGTLVGTDTIPLTKLTTSGIQGFLGVNDKGQVISYQKPT